MIMSQALQFYYQEQDKGVILIQLSIMINKSIILVIAMESGQKKILKRLLNYTNEQLDKEMLPHSTILVGVINMELEWKKMLERLLNYIIKQLDRDILLHNLILVGVTSMEQE